METMNIATRHAGRPIVFITQMPTRKDPASGMRVPSVDVGPAAEHGDLHMMMPTNTSFYATADLVRSLRDQLKVYDYSKGDSVLALGDPSVLFIAGSVLKQWSNQYRILKWDRRIARYLGVEVSL